METRKCVQCGNDFTLTNSEISFYKSKGFSLPKRCANCRKENRKSTGKEPVKNTVPKATIYKENSQRSSFSKKRSKNVPLKIAIRIIFISLLLIIACFLQSLSSENESEYYYFRNEELLMNHYYKHGSETGSNTANEYLQKANNVIDNENALIKYEAEDGDKVYFVESTGEIVFVSTDGKIRTYFIADKDYFERT